ncbi:MAG: hypothetical protein EOO73_19935 [Myxococcales bacterium]|nr:MAG: hypothetical protein EOO73_19935 [Myxococcales bacterium]
MRAFPCFFAVLLLVAGCGAGSSSGAEPKSAADATNADESEAAPSSGGGDEASEAAEASSKPAGPSCDDGTCSQCGSGICPAGWYCDEKASGGAACSWLAECAEKATCGCVTRVLGSACKCREEGGGLKVACD